ncbi:HNH endonuclease [Sorangium sp. So ce296]|uniref:HNH endonuclease n=1 Tax=Sorangium sp. So ce296 TaxID=3133296 RepID=UPI003F645071
MGLAVGQIVGGLAITIGGLTGEVFGGITSATGIGAAIGVPAIAVSSGLVVGGVGNIAAGIQGLSQALMSQGSGSKGPQGTAPTATERGPRRFSPEQRERGLERARDADGVPRCEHCGTELTTKPGEPNTYEADHRIPYSRGGPTMDKNLDPTCRTCNRSKGAQTPEEWRRR